MNEVFKSLIYFIASFFTLAWMLCFQLEVCLNIHKDLEVSIPALLRERHYDSLGALLAQ